MYLNKSENENTQRISDAIFLYAITKKIKFEFNEFLLTAEEVSNEIGFLALFLMEAKELFDSINGNIYALKYAKSIERLPVRERTFPVSFKKQEGTVLDIVPVLHGDEMFYDILTFTLHVVSTYVEQNITTKKNITNMVSLDALYDKHIDKVERIRRLE